MRFNSTSGDCIFNRHPPSIDAVPQRAVADAGFTRPFRESFAIITNVVTSVVLLFALGGPSTVVRCVVPVDIDSIHAVTLGGSPTHVGEKRSVVIPPITHGNPTAAVVLPSVIVRVIASLSHHLPRLIFKGDTEPRTTFTVGQSMFSLPNFSLKAPTGFSVSGGYGIGVNGLCRTAVALTDPTRISFSIRRTFDYDETRESLSGFDHGSIDNMVHIQWQRRIS